MTPIADDPVDSGALHLLAIRIPDGSAPLPVVNWAALIATVAAWPAGEIITPVVERRLWRSRGRGGLQQTLTAALHDPLRIYDCSAARAELEELLRPIRAGRALPRLTPAKLIEMRCAELRFMAELRDLHSVIPEGGGALAPLFAQLVSGLERMVGTVGISLIVTPVRNNAEAAECEESGETDPQEWAARSRPTATDHRRGDQPQATRRVAFALRLYASTPVPIAIRARAEALTLARRALPGDWRFALDSDELAAAARALATFSLDPPSAGDLGVDPDIAAITLALPAASTRGPRHVAGRPITGRLPSDGPVIGRVTRPSGRTAPWRLSWDTRRHHCFVSAASGAGKTTLLQRVALDDIEQGRAVILIDPHGDVVHQLAGAVPSARLRLIDPRIVDTHPLDLLDPNPERAAAHLLSAASEVWPSEYVGPVWHHAMSLATRGMHVSSATSGRFSLLDVERFITDAAWRGEVIAGVDDARLQAELTRDHRAWQMTPSGNDNTLVSWAAAKLTPLTQGPGAGLFAEAPQNSLEDDIRAGAVLLVALPIGTLGDSTTRLVARMLLTRLTAAIAQQGDLPERQRRETAVFLDEAHLMAGHALRGLFAQARKFNCAVTVACQSPSQLEPGLEEVLTNAQTHLLGRLSHREALRVADRIGEAGVRTLPTLPRHHLLLALEDNDPMLEPVVLTPVPVPSLPSVNDTRGRLGRAETQQPAATEPQREPESVVASAYVNPQPSFDELLDELFPLTRRPG